MNIHFPLSAKIIKPRPSRLLRAAAPQAAVERAEFLPMAPADKRGDIDETLLLTSKDGHAPSYIPVYELATNVVGITGGGEEQRYRLQLSPDGADWVLTLHLVARPSPQLRGPADQVQKAQPLTNGPIQVCLSFNVRAASGSFRRELYFQEVSQEDTGLKARLRLSKLSDQAQVGSSLIDPEALPQLRVIRSIQVGVDMPLLPQDTVERLNKLRTLLSYEESVYQVAQRFPQMVPERFKGGVDMLKKLIDDHRQEIQKLQDAVNAAGNQTRLDVLSLTLPQVVTPEPFCLKTHPYVFGVPLERYTRAIGLLQKSVGGTRYYLDAEAPWQVFYLPDEFALSVKPNGAPVMTIWNTTDPNLYRLSYTAQPVIDVQRLERDTPALRELAAKELGNPAPEIQFEPLLGDKVTVILNLPQEGGWTPVPRPNVLTDLHAQIEDELMLTAVQLRQFYDALFAQDTALFSGSIEVEVGTWATERVPFKGRLTGNPRDIWQQVRDPKIPSEFTTAVRVEAHQEVFDKVASVTVWFENADKVVLTREKPAVTTQVSKSIDDFVLQQKVGKSAFRYKVCVGADCNPDTAPWLEGTQNPLILTAASLPA